METYSISKISDYKINADLLLAQFQDSQKLKGMMQAMGDSRNDLETAIFEIRSEFEIDSAVGDQLDILGSIFAEDREGRDDTEYRQAIKAKGARQYSGEPESIIEILKASYGATYVHYRPYYDAKYYISTDVDITSEDLIPISPAGVQPFVEGYYLVDALGRYIVDALGRRITAVR
jgi:hypothetical protein